MLSYNTLNQQARDPDLMNRVVACTTQEAFNNETLGATDYADKVRRNSAEAASMMWPVCIDTEAQYASALAGGIPSPGGDESVITDANILAAVQANWPQDEAPA